jgi:hypothetical protein
MKVSDLIEKSKRAVKRFFSRGEAIMAEEFIENNKAKMEEVKRLATEHDALMEELENLNRRLAESSHRILTVLFDMAVKNNMDCIKYSH